MRQSLNASLKKLKDLGESLDLEEIGRQIEELDRQQNEENFWSDQKKAQSVIKEVNKLKDLKSRYEQNKAGIEGILKELDELNKNYDAELFELLEEEYEQINADFEEFEIKVLLSNDYDHSNALLEIHPGAGGTESQDWAEMLFRMYQRYAQNNGYGFEVISYEEADEAGIKSCLVAIKGDMAYGYLTGESGVHRLVRISPFDASSRRHTSFASVEVLPEFNNEIEIEIRDEDLEVDTMRSSGAGGQHINKTDSAVRMTHKPTGIVVFCQTQRSQLQNREACINMLKSKLLQLRIKENEARAAAVRGEVKANEWGSQIRSYVFHPYSMVKDLRTGYEVGNTQSVMDGDLDGFIDSYLRSQIKG